MKTPISLSVAVIIALVVALSWPIVAAQAGDDSWDVIRVRKNNGTYEYWWVSNEKARDRLLSDLAKGKTIRESHSRRRITEEEARAWQEKLKKGRENPKEEQDQKGAFEGSAKKGRAAERQKHESNQRKQRAQKGKDRKATSPKAGMKKMRERQAN